MPTNAEPTTTGIGEIDKNIKTMKRSAINIINVIMSTTPFLYNATVALTTIRQLLHGLQQMPFEQLDTP